ncbi:MAG: reverse transcriptase family protein [Endomicrobiales bacterium]
MIRVMPACRGIKDVNELAELLQIDKPALLQVVATINSHYKSFILEKNGKKREIDSPSSTLKSFQNSLKQSLQQITLPKSFYSGVRNISYLDNAKLHVGRGVVITLDIKDFFPSIKPYMVRHMFEQILGCAPDVADILTRLTTYRRRIPQGAPTSNMVANLAILRLFKRIRGFCNQNGMKYGLVVDDITISGDKGSWRIVQLLKRILEDEGFEIHPNKQNVQRQNQRQTVTKLVINHRVGAPREYRRKLRAILYNCMQKGPESQKLKEQSIEKFKKSLYGKILFLKQFHPKESMRYIEMFNTIKWPNSKDEVGSSANLPCL